MSPPRSGRAPLSRIAPALFLALGSAAGACLFFATGHGRALPVALVVALAAGVGAVWEWRALAAGRWRAALDAYAEREIGRTQRASPQGGKLASPRANSKRVPASLPGRRPSVLRKGE
jgi:hypothetical protein